MGKKEYTPVFVMAVAVAALLASSACGIGWLKLNQALSSQRHELSDARRQLLAMDQALLNQRRDLSDARKQLAALNDRFADAQKNNQTLNQQLTEIQSTLRGSEQAGQAHIPQFPQIRPGLLPGAGPDVPAADSVEGKLRADGRHWERAPGQIALGIFVEDTLVGRMNQPRGRGCIGKVMSTSPNEDGHPCATVDFGHGWTTGIMFSELSPIRFVGPDLR